MFLSLIAVCLLSIASASFLSGLTLYSESNYDENYLREYKKMMKSLLKGTSVNLLNPELNLKRFETRTVSRSYGQYHQNYPECGEIGLNNMKTVKVIQDEEANFLMLKKGNNGKLYVEKSTQSYSSFESEIEFFSHLNPQNKYFPILKCFMRTPGRENRNSIITEFIAGQDSHILASRANPEQLKSMVKQLFEAIVDLHGMGYIHSDIKPGNVLVTDDFKVKLIDFGMARRVGNAKMYRGSPYTRAPELHGLCPGKVDVAIDWWAFGSTISIWYYYNYKYGSKLKSVKTSNSILTPNLAMKYFQHFSSYDFTPMKWKGENHFVGSIFPSSFNSNVKSFLSIFLTIDPDFRTFDSERLQNIVRNHKYFTS